MRKVEQCQFIPPPDSPSDIVRVRRTGGFAGRTAGGEVRLDADDPRAPDVRALVAGIDFASIKPSPTQPDRFIYVFTVHGREVVVQEHQLTDNMRLLASLVIDESR